MVVVGQRDVAGGFHAGCIVVELGGIRFAGVAESETIGAGCQAADGISTVFIGAGPSHFLPALAGPGVGGDPQRGHGQAGILGGHLAGNAAGIGQRGIEARQVGRDSQDNIFRFVQQALIVEIFRGINALVVEELHAVFTGAQPAEGILPILISVGAVHQLPAVARPAADVHLDVAQRRAAVRPRHAPGNPGRRPEMHIDASELLPGGQRDAVGIVEDRRVGIASPGVVAALVMELQAVFPRGQPVESVVSGGIGFSPAGPSPLGAIPPECLHGNIREDRGAAQGGDGTRDGGGAFQRGINAGDVRLRRHRNVSGARDARCVVVILGGMGLSVVREEHAVGARH
ncbi:MAG: hypothetical protein BWX54_00557 [Verrucomicrobia bacterium ADurb.Bin018]|nr:MAG: hypothetical protein BWX54_00557 [Verrucomicrobia bacterium ADurb.Bin018]